MLIAAEVSCWQEYEQMKDAFEELNKKCENVKEILKFLKEKYQE